MTPAEARTYDRNMMIRPNDIAQELTIRSGIDDNVISEDLENALYTIEAYAQNEYNADYWRTLLNVLVTFADKSENNRRISRYAIIRTYKDITTTDEYIRRVFDKDNIRTRLMQITGNDQEITEEALTWIDNADIGDIYTFRDGLIQIVEIAG